MSGANLREIVRDNIVRGSKIYSDENHTTQFAARGYLSDSVRHKDGEYVKGDAHTNTVEGYFAILKRGIIGTYHHVSEQHLARYLAEFSFRYSNRERLGVNDTQRASLVLKGAKGKRLTYERTNLSA